MTNDNSKESKHKSRKQSEQKQVSHKPLTGRIETMEKEILINAIPWLQIDDALACCCVSSFWNQTLNKEDFLWKQLCESSHPEGARVYGEATANQNNYKKIALTLSHRTHLDTPPTNPLPLFQSSVGIENYYAVVDFFRRVTTSCNKRRFETVGTFVCESLCESEHNWCFFVGTDQHGAGRDTGVVIKGANPYAEAPEYTSLTQEDVDKKFEEQDLFECVATDAAGTYTWRMDGRNTSSVLACRVTLHRRDNNKYVVIFDNGVFSPNDTCDTNWDTFGYNVWGDSDIKFDPSTREGVKAMCMIDKKPHGALVDSTFDLKVQDLPDEPDWFTAFRFADEDSLAENFVDNLPTLCKIQSFNCVVENFRISFFYHGAGESNAEDTFSRQEMEVILDGLGWQ